MLLGGFVAGLVAWMFVGTGTSRSPTVTRFFHSPPDTDLITRASGPVVSPDGSRIVYAAMRGGVPQLFVRTRDELEARPIPNTEGGWMPFFSPDGEWVGYFAHVNLGIAPFNLPGPDSGAAPPQGGRDLVFKQALMKISLSGGPPVTLAQGRDSPMGATWGPDDIIVYGFADVGGLMAISAKGGELRRLTTTDRGSSHLWPAFSPDGGSVFFTISTGPSLPEPSSRTTPTIAGDLDRIARDKRVVVLSLATGEYETVVEGTGPRVSPSEHLVFGREDSLWVWAAPFDFGDRVMTGAPHRIVEGVQVNTAPGWTHYALANDGTLVYLPSSVSAGSC